MKEIKDIRIEEYDYPLPDERIAKFPLEERDQSKLLLYKKGEIGETRFFNLPQQLPENSLMVFNNTRVIRARMIFHKETGARIEIFCLEPTEPRDYSLSFQQTGSVVWTCIVGNLKKWKGNLLKKTVQIEGKDVKITAELINQGTTSHQVRISWSPEEFTFAQILEATGIIPIPPYLHRDTCESDLKTYQTVYSRINGSVAAPTAGLHFTQNVFKELEAKGIGREELTLHVGAGTFKPVKSDTIQEHEMHTEVIAVTKSTIKNVLKNIGHIIAVGTTSIRTLESLYWMGVRLEKDPNLELMELKIQQWEPYQKGQLISVEQALQNILDYLEKHDLEVLNSATQIMIAPGYDFKVISGMVTNFHQPRSTLLLLISAFIGEDWRKVYDYALNHEFRFLSYGDSSLFLKE